MIAYFPDMKVTSEMVSESAGCNAVIIRNLFAKLKKAGLLSVKAGRGDTSLAKPPEEITLWDIYSAVETVHTDEIFKIHPNTSFSCLIGSNLHGLLIKHLDDAVDAMKTELSGVTLQTVINELNSQLNEPINAPKACEQIKDYCRSERK
jgi:DNA-binding IscR family transcriptional regulator